MASMFFTLNVFHSFPDPFLMSWLNSNAPLNMEDMSVTAAVFHLLVSVLMLKSNSSAPLNMEAMVVTAAVFQLVMPALPLEAAPKAAAPLNIFDMSFTATVFHLSVWVWMSWSNSNAPLNMEAMLSTSLVFQFVMSLLNFAAPSNMEAMVVTAAVFQLVMSPLLVPKAAAP